MKAWELFMQSGNCGGWQWMQLPLTLLLIGSFNTSCTPAQSGANSPSQASAQSATPPAQKPSITAVDVSVATRGSVQAGLDYAGTTEPVQQVALRSQVEGQLLQVQVDVGDPVQQGQVVARLEDRLLQGEVNQAKAILATQESEVERAKGQVSSARTQVEQARLQLQQAEADALRFQELLSQGAIAAQRAEQAQTTALAAKQALRAAESEVATLQQAVSTAQSRVKAQQALVAQTQQEQSYAILTSPITGSVLARPSEPGTLKRPGEEILTLGDFSRIKVVVKVSELDLAQVRLGQQVQIQLDAFPEREWTGQVSRIGLVADPQARLIPIEIQVPNPDQRIRSGLLARAQFPSTAVSRVLVPQGALQDPQGKPSVFVVTQKGSEGQVIERTVKLGGQADGQVEILGGVQAGEAVVVRSSKPLKSGETVRVSVISTSSLKRKG